ncbi:MAG: glycosyltransferase family 4 protein [Candidatus Nanopelagicales bacterium]|nr:glycosyltransferase family 4 protein [Candidatus Nanopelagicales bacterium]
MSTIRPAAVWNTEAVGQIESVAWPVVSGWVAQFSGRGEPSVRLEITGLGSMALRAHVPRRDVQAHLGVAGVAGFWADVSALTAYAPFAGSRVALTSGVQVLDDQELESTLEFDARDCIGRVGVGASGSSADGPAGWLSRRFLQEAEPVIASDWLSALKALGVHDQPAGSWQWAQFFDFHGFAAEAIAGWLALEGAKSSGVPALAPLPGWLRQRLEEPAGRIGEQSATVLDAMVSAATLGEVPTSTWLVPLVDCLAGDERAGATGECSSATPPWGQSPAVLPLESARVCVAGLVRHRSGLGQNADYSVDALRAAGAHACLAPFFPGRGGWSSRLAPSAGAVRELQDHAVLLHVPIDRVVSTLSAQPALMASPKIIGNFFWEIEVIPGELQRGLDLVDEVWAATDFMADAYRAVTDTPVHVTGNVVDVSGVETWDRRSLGIAQDAFVVHFSFDANSTVARKNPNAVIDAFHEAFEGDPNAVLVLKVRNFLQVEGLARGGCRHARGLLLRLAEHSDVVLVTDELSRGAALGLIQGSDCYLSLHRAEGFGYSMAEAMALGTPVIATAYSGNLDFMSGNEAWLVPSRQLELVPGDYFYWQPGMHWAEPDVHAAAACLTHVREGSQAEARARAARTRIEQSVSMSSLADRYAALLGLDNDRRSGNVAGVR